MFYPCATKYHNIGMYAVFLAISHLVGMSDVAQLRNKAFMNSTDLNSFVFTKIYGYYIHRGSFLHNPFLVWKTLLMCNFTFIL